MDSMEGMEGKISGHQKITQSNCFRNELKKKKKTQSEQQR